MDSHKTIRPPKSTMLKLIVYMHLVIAWLTNYAKSCFILTMGIFFFRKSQLLVHSNILFKLQILFSKHKVSVYNILSQNKTNTYYGLTNDWTQAMILNLCGLDKSLEPICEFHTDTKFPVDIWFLVAAFKNAKYRSK